MFEFDKYQKSRHAEPVAPGPHPYQPVIDLAAVSQLFWGEHCIECAAPDCYASCDLYRRRQDGRCRRFSYGIYKNRRFSSVRGFGAEVSFKTWGRLKANGNVRMEPIAAVIWKERLLGLTVAVVGAIGSLLHGCTGQSRWSELGPDLDSRARRLNRCGTGICKPDAFLMEVYNPSPQPVTVQLQIRVGEDFLDNPIDRANLPAPFVATVNLKSGYSRHQFERALFEPIIESHLPFKLTLEPEGDDSTTLVFLTLDFVTYREDQAPAAAVDAIKCVVFDLDNTLWDGVLLESEAVRFREDAVRVIKALDGRGILLSVVSKNDHHQALEKLKALSLEEYFLHPQINWLPKSRNISEIAAQLNLGLETFAFVDDSAFERDEVTQSLPQVMCIDAGNLEGLLDHPRFQGSDSVEAQNRRSYYRDAIVRNRVRREYESDYSAFLASSKIKLEVNCYQPADFDRVAELAQRTNQLNFSGTKYSREQLRQSLADKNLRGYVLRCTDKYGSYGTVGLSLVRNEDKEMRIEEFMLSCRVQGKYLEKAYFAYVLQHANGERPSTLWVNFRPTNRNTPAQQVLADLNFEPDDSGHGLALDLNRYPVTCGIIEVVSEDTPARVSS